MPCVCILKNQVVSNLRVWKGADNTVKAGFAEDFVLPVPKGFAQRLTVEMLSQQPLVAPVLPGQTVGTLRVSIDGKPYGDYPAVALEGVPMAGFSGG